MSGPNSVRDVDQLAELREEYVQAENSGDVEGILRTFSDDIIVIPPESPPVRGMDAAEDFLSDFLEAFEIEIELSSEEVVVDGNHAYDWGTVSGTITPPEGQTQEVNNTYLIVYQLDSEGDWRQSIHTWNANA